MRDDALMAAASSPDMTARRGQPSPTAQADPAPLSKAARRREVKAARRREAAEAPRCRYCGRRATGTYRVHTGLWEGVMPLCGYHLAKADKAAHTVSVKEV